MDTRAMEGPNQFVSALAHEMRNPLATINLAVKMLKSLTKISDHQLYLDIVLKASEQINDLITDLFRIWQPDEMQPETTIDILKANDGTVDVRSKVGKGTRFILSKLTRV